MHGPTGRAYLYLPHGSKIDVEAANEEVTPRSVARATSSVGRNGTDSTHTFTRPSGASPAPYCMVYGVRVKPRKDEQFRAAARRILEAKVATRISHLSPIDVPEPRGNPSANTGSPFHPSRTGPDVSRGPIHLRNPGANGDSVRYVIHQPVSGMTGTWLVLLLFDSLEALDPDGHLNVDHLMSQIGVEGAAATNEELTHSVAGFWRQPLRYVEPFSNPGCDHLTSRPQHRMERPFGDAGP